jgi:hypothetical protein
MSIFAKLYKRSAGLGTFTGARAKTGRRSTHGMRHSLFDVTQNNKSSPAAPEYASRLIDSLTTVVGHDRRMISMIEFDHVGDHAGL